ncbi:HAMP domain-containing sensor histidine kinase [Paenibacillus sonchi]|uniref:HAMP domain-containing sensor histidine kinase n=1 Tax=Paenibacillus sonchi TaxID=373687 RepID=UPI001E48CA8F|nr:HAMP domain-containing sensor histidine kinase [Paenibacillus sonchi]MCE3202363.1 HAMP domain-containing histidine kinase [Paenibacillus sonchi]
MKRSGIFIKVFIYTIIFSALLVGATAALFSQQLMFYFSRLRMEGISDAFQRMADQSQGEDDITELARRFYERDPSFQFYIRDKAGHIIYETPGADLSGIAIGQQPPGGKNSTILVNLNKDYNFHALRDDVFAVNYDKWIARALVMLSAMFAVCVIGAFVFARQMTKPIQTLANNTTKMSNLEEVPPLPERKDELGTLARDIHSMYDKLKDTISKLEDEILRERELEETQRYFFSAASHELKTPIAATSVLLEGMLENVGDYKDHPKYLRECVKMMDAQSKMISEILEIVNLNNGKIVPVPERLDIRHIVADMLPNYRTLSEANGQRMVMNILDGQTCFTDPQMLKKVLSNIILNAVQNTPEGGEIRIWSEPVADRYRLCILNTRARIGDAVLPKLFDPFYRVDQARSRKNGRSGLGLTIVQKTLEAMEIGFALENTPDGVLFWIELPKAL